MRYLSIGVICNMPRQLLALVAVIGGLLCGLMLPAQALACTLQYLVVDAMSNEPLLSWSDAGKATLGDSIKLRISPGSYVSASVMLNSSGTDACTGITATALAATAAGRPALAAANIDIRYVKRWYQAGTAWVGIAPTTPRKLVPELLLKDSQLVQIQSAGQRNLLRMTRNGQQEYVDVSKSAQLTDGSLIPTNADFDVRDADTLQPFDVTKESTQLWLSVSVPANAAPGVYNGAVVLGNPQQLLRIPMQITVLPFALPPPALEYSIFYRSQLSKTGTVSSEYKNEEQYRAELRDLRKHGISNPDVYQEFGDTTLLQQALSIRREEGFTDKRIYFLGLSAASAVDAPTRTILQKNIARLKIMLNANGYTDPYLFAIDESGSAGQLRQLDSWRSVHDAGARVFATGRAGTFAHVGSTLDTLVLAFEPDATEIRQFHAAGNRVLTYAFPQTGPENPLLFRRNYGIRLWSAGVDGAMPYAYMHSFGSSWNDFDHKEYRDHHFVYPTVNGVIPTMAWEGFHEAVDDVRYITALQQSLESAIGLQRCGSNPCAEVQAAQSYLQQLKQTTENADPAKVRDTVIDHVLALMSPQAPTLFVVPKATGSQ